MINVTKYINIFFVLLYCYSVYEIQVNHSELNYFFQSCPLASAPFSRCIVVCCNSRNSTSDGAKVQTAAGHAILCAHACEVSTGYIHRLSDCVCHQRAPSPVSLCDADADAELPITEGQRVIFFS